ncbi:MAG: putative DNA binding domain-containing protein [Candidatus Methanoplasma sp.]|jgi:predicted HTH transcriptional regulator|nr:putative DNA binding domain-containing protein [Candidatus Methanoplasma sp.]
MRETIAGGESNLVEFKRELPSDSRGYLKTIIAFSNTAGGSLLIGVSGDGAVCGVPEDRVQRIRDSIADSISSACEPVPLFNIKTYSIDGKTVLAVTVYPGEDRPYHFRNTPPEKTCFVRKDKITRLADASRYRELTMEGAGTSFDAQVNFGLALTDESMEKVCSDLSEIGGRRFSPKDLRNMRLIVSGEGESVPTNAYALLDGSVFVAATVRCACFRGTSKPTDRELFIDQRECEGPVYRQIEEAHAFVMRNIRLASYLDGTITRKDVPEIPADVIREAVTNAVLHRSYLRGDLPTYVSVYDDRVEIRSPGKLYGDLRVEEVIDGRTGRRNPILAKAFAAIHVSEGFGLGIGGMISKCERSGLRAPSFEEDGDDFLVTIFRRDSREPVAPLDPRDADAEAPMPARGHRGGSRGPVARASPRRGGGGAILWARG